jgi:protein-tyrosine-phosphatase
MAEGLLRSGLDRRGISGVTVVSTGTWGVDGESATRPAVAVMNDRGISIGSHRARSLETSDLERADLVIAMTSVHRREIQERKPEAGPKVLLLKELSLMHPDRPDNAGPDERLAALLAAERPEYQRALDLDDPMGLPIGVYERCAQELEAGIKRLLSLLWP